MPFTNPLVAGTTLIRTAISSPDYVAGVSGWSIKKDGTVEFNNGVFRGSLVTGSTTIDDNGIRFVGNDETLSIENIYGFVVQPTTPDGRNVRIDVDGTTGDSSTAFILMSPKSPSDLGNAVNDAALEAYITNVGGTDEYPTLFVKAPDINGKSYPYILMFAQSSASASDNSQMQIYTNTARFYSTQLTVDGTIRVGPLNQEIAQGTVSGAHSQSNSVAAGAAESIALTCTSQTFQAGHVYKVQVYGETSCSVVPNMSLLRVRKTNAAGQVIGEIRTPCTTAGFGTGSPFVTYFQVSGTNVTASLVVTVMGGGAFTATHNASGTLPRGCVITDEGSNANPAYSGVVALV